MCGLIFGILLLVCGLWAIVTGKLPAIVFGKKYQLEGPWARLIGVLLALPLPVSFTIDVALILLLGEERAEQYAGIVNLLIWVLALVTAWVMSRLVRKPQETV